MKNEHFNVWLRLGGLSDFASLYGRITSTLDKGTVLQFKVKNNFNVDSFKGKNIVVGTSSALGGNVRLCGSASRISGVAMCGIALLFLAKSAARRAEVGRRRTPAELSLRRRPLRCPVTVVSPPSPSRAKLRTRSRSRHAVLIGCAASSNSSRWQAGIDEGRMPFRSFFSRRPPTMRFDTTFELVA